MFHVSPIFLNSFCFVSFVIVSCLPVSPSFKVLFLYLPISFSFVSVFSFSFVFVSLLIHYVLHMLIFLCVFSTSVGTGFVLVVASQGHLVEV